MSGAPGEGTQAPTYAELSALWQEERVRVRATVARAEAAEARLAEYVKLAHHAEELDQGAIGRAEEARRAAEAKVTAQAPVIEAARCLQGVLAGQLSGCERLIVRALAALDRQEP